MVVVDVGVGIVVVVIANFQAERGLGVASIRSHTEVVLCYPTIAGVSHQ